MAGRTRCNVSEKEKPQARRLQESAAAGWSASDGENIELFQAVIDFTYFLYGRICASSHRSSMTLRHCP